MDKLWINLGLLTIFTPPKTAEILKTEIALLCQAPSCAPNLFSLILGELLYITLGKTGGSRMKLIKLSFLTGIMAVLLAVPAQAQDQDIFEARTQGDGTVHIYHLNAYHNCCSLISNEVSVVGYNIYVHDTEPYHGSCWCICYFDVEAVVSDLPAGSYNIEYTYDSDESPSNEDWVVEYLGIVVPEWGTPPADPSFVSSTSDCHELEPVSVDSVRWDHIKSIYR